MNNHDNGIGEKVREIRLKCGMTQRELAGDKITRNMLSLIESGNASPSVSTLIYISERLKTPIGFFFTESDSDIGNFIKMSVIEELKSCFRSKNFHKCQEICSSIPENAVDDEIAYILAVSYIHTASENAYALDIKKAASDLDKASSFASRSIYCENKITKAVSYLSELFSNICADTVPDLLCNFEYGSEFIPISEIQYFNSLKRFQNGDNILFEFSDGSHYEKHITALKLLSENRVTEAQKKLRDLSLDSTTPYFMQYHILSDLENAANISGDYRLAYSSSRRKLEFIKRYKI